MSLSLPECHCNLLSLHHCIVICPSLSELTFCWEDTFLAWHCCWVDVVVGSMSSLLWWCCTDSIISLATLLPCQLSHSINIVVESSSSLGWYCSCIDIIASFSWCCHFVDVICWDSCSGDVVNGLKCHQDIVSAYLITFLFTLKLMNCCVDVVLIPLNHKAKQCVLIWMIIWYWQAAHPKNGL